jgi:hypothetical protein
MTDLLQKCGCGLIVIGARFASKFFRPLIISSPIIGFLFTFWTLRVDWHPYHLSEAMDGSLYLCLVEHACGWHLAGYESHLLACLVGHLGVME